MFTTGIVVYDPEDLDGRIEHGPANVERSINRGCAVLPYDEDRAADPLSYARRAYGAEGIRVDNIAGDQVCTMVVKLLPDRPWLYWTAVLEGRGQHPQGTIRLVEDRANAFAVGSGFAGGGNDLVTTNLRETEREIVGGRRRVAVALPTVMVLCLRVQAVGVSVLVAAVSQSKIDVPYP